MVRVPESMTANEFLCGDFTPAQKRIAELEAEVERLREQVNLLMFRLDNLKRHPEFIHLEPQP